MTATPSPSAPPAPAAPASAPVPEPLDLEESVAGEEDPGASLDLGIAATPEAPPPRTPEGPGRPGGGTAPPG